MDTLHALTLFSIFTVITATAYSLKMVKKNKIEKAHRFDMIMAAVVRMRQHAQREQALPSTSLGMPNHGMEIGLD